MSRTERRLRLVPRLLALSLAAMIVASCSFGTASSPGPLASGSAASSALFDASVVHELSLSFGDAAYERMISAYTSSGAKDWIEATVTVDGRTYEHAGIRLKGNSSLRGLLNGGGRPGGNGGNVSADSPASLPWLVDLDQVVDGQNHGGITEFVVRSNSSATALNEAVALELLEQAGLGSQDAIAVRFAVNGEDPVLRLVIENPDNTWMAIRFSSSGALYKAESTGDYSYRGEDPNAYDEVFDQEAGKDNADLTPLIEFLDFINNADDATFAANIESRLDVDSFITYLAMQDIVSNFDDIDGPGNNSYLYYDTTTRQFTVVPWDYNLALGTGMGGFGPGGNGGGRPGGFEPPFVGEGQGPGGGPGPGFGGRSNVLSERFLAIAAYGSAVAERTTELREKLVNSGVAAAALGEWVEVLKAQATDLVGAETIQAEADRIAGYF